MFKGLNNIYAINIYSMMSEQFKPKTASKRRKKKIIHMLAMLFIEYLVMFLRAKKKKKI